ncbi:TetR/AcrR family transcriptional regulator [Treponema brennaborense]|uniref:Regulatory protein TetR n=1 Tax=Treponema brennaborense (strain DSM 12168 / CIP 105900 / DD5/3) TaxID=906968 RepID=F4LIL3_TREBD|nr:TetR/AcrR family transcriptional regulator [Treponema brennaborense]AEE17238.1 regulatory protein TetR [Treponema brennaborense DSM 12168]
MPAPLSEKERAEIKRRLTDAAESCLKTTGIRKTSVDELTRRAGIAKGTFYLFYPSKELLFFDVINAFHETAERLLAARLKEVAYLDARRTLYSVAPSVLADIFTDLFRFADGSFMPELIRNGELEYLMRKLPDEAVAAHHAADAAMFERLTAVLPDGMGKKHTAEVVSAAFRLLFLTLLHKREIGEAVYFDAVGLLLNGLIKEL